MLMSPEIKRILVAIALVPEYSFSQKHLSYAAYLADKTGARLCVLSVINQRDIDAAALYSRLVGAQSLGVEEFKKMEIERREKSIKEIIEQSGLDRIDKDVIIVIGNPYSEIMKTIEENSIDLVIMGTRGASKYDKYTVMTGSVAERVFKHSPVPVLSIRE
jgi:nucleotide-binding universal stress UspA family protein